MEKIIEDLGDEYIVSELGTYDESSVLAGQEKKNFIEDFTSLELAKTAYPNATVIDGSYRCHQGQLSDCPPAWFDPANAGETW